MSSKDGIRQEQLADLDGFEASLAFSELEKQVLRYTDALTRTPADVPDDLFQSLRQDLDPQQMVELATTIAWENFRARFNRAFGIESEGFTEGTSCPIHLATPGRGGRSG